MTLPTVPLGSTDMSITRVGFGAWAVGGGGWKFGWGSSDDDESVRGIRYAVDQGVNWLDTAPVYGLGHSEQVVGRALRDMPAADRPYVFTKCGLTFDRSRPDEGPHNVLATASLRREVEDSLRRLGVDRIDLYQVHWPPEDSTPLAEYWQTMLDLKEQGLVRAVGLSNHGIDQLTEAEAVGHVDSLQPPFSLIHRGMAADLLPWCRESRTGVMVYSPMQAGLLTRRHDRRAGRRDARRRLAGLASGLHRPPARKPAAGRGAGTGGAPAWRTGLSGRGGVDAGLGRRHRRHRRRPASGADR